MKFYLTKTPYLVQKLFSSYIWRYSTKKKELFLTFDDGPTPMVTPFVLDELKKINAKATFFCIGKNIKAHPEIFQRIIAEGHSVGNHTNNHLKGLKTSTSTYIENVLIAEKEIEKYTSNQQFKRLFRPPYGKFKFSQAKQLKKLGYQIIMWDILSADFDTSITNKKCLGNVLNNVKKGGSIIVFHDSEKAFKKIEFILPKILKTLKQQGFRFTPI